MDIYECYNPEACPGGLETDSCSRGYGGNLCHACVKEDDTWFSKQADSSCEKCMNYNKNVLVLTGVIAIVFIYIVCLVFINVSNTGGQRQTAVYMRILTNYF